MIYSFVYRYVNNFQETEDITQEVFVRVWRSIKKPVLGVSYGFNPKKGNFKTWIFSIAKNASLDSLKKSRLASGGKKVLSFSDLSARGESAFGGENEEGENQFIDTLKDPNPLPSEVLDRANITQKLNSIMEKLPAPYRMTLFLYYNDHFNFREIAEILNEPLNTVKSRHRRALIELKKLLSDP